MNIKKFKEISIRGRMAYCIKVLERTFDSSKLDRNGLEIILPHLWEFTFSNSLDEWLEKIRQLCPECILDSEYFEVSSLLNKKHFLTLKSFYKELPETFVEMIDNTVWVGICNVYSSTGSYSKCSFEYLLDVIKDAKKLNVELPCIEPFEKFKFSNDNGWGGTFKPEDI